ncbi:alpha/beta fold hydrolase [Catellatospora bangladeshensis]|uniref:alpha/beta fold hydrolase n=1 Tax=Catellatospora bangladeshensis TaxID=310355 RepID=UPI00361C95D4
MSTRRVLTGVAAVLAVALTFAVAAPAAAAARKQTKPTIVLVHGAFADSSSWNAVIPLLQAQGYPVVAAPNALRGVSSDAAEVAALLKTISGPIVLVGHSYGGSVISNAAEGNPNVKALVYVSAFAPEVGRARRRCPASSRAARSRRRWRRRWRWPVAAGTCTSTGRSSAISSRPTCPRRWPRRWERGSGRSPRRR